MKKGFTLVELIIALALLTALTGAIFCAFAQDLRNWRRITGRAAQLQTQNIIAERLCREVRAGKLLPGSSSTELLLQLGPETVSYDLYGDKIRRKKGGTSAYWTSEREITRLVFSYPPDGTINVLLDDISFAVAGRNQ
jgi:prepilin-type N-terminal cleavage/methylation domain-containing protein